MEIKTKFNHGERVQAITLGTEEYQETCCICEGKGHFYYKDKKIECSEQGCWGNGYILKAKPNQWFVPKDTDFQYSNFVIQKIGIELYNPNNKKVNNNKSWIYYMAASSGTMWNENDCFASIEEAQKECDKRNKTLKE